jgi:glyoxylase-like metal-dependent hydrolase (beta-lactamase superfamily II)
MATELKYFFDADTFTMTYVVWDPVTHDAVIIDPVLDYDMAASKVSFQSLELLTDFIKSKGIKPLAVIETHAHADHLSSSQKLKEIYPGLKVAIGEKITLVQKTFAEIFNFPSSFKADGSQFEKLLKDGEVWQVGSIKVKAMHTPGHTPACAVYLIDERAFVGDLIFMPDSGTGRCDFPGGDAHALYKSVQKLYSLPEHYEMYVGHDYQPNGRPLQFKVTIAEQKRSNIHIKATTTENEFVEMRTTRDKTLKAPRLLLPSVQINIRAGQMPEPAANGKCYLNIPIS